MILYFSATGNGKYIAEQIAAETDDKAISIVDCIREGKYLFKDEKNIGYYNSDVFLEASKNCNGIFRKTYNR